MRAFTFISFLLSCTLFSMSLQAEQKIGYCDSAAIVSFLPATKTADDQIRSLGETFQTKANAKMEEARAKNEEMAALNEAGTLTEELSEQGILEMQRLQQEFQTLQAEANEAVENRRSVLMRPIMKMVNEAIVTVSEREGFAMVFDRRETGLVYATEGLDITVLVLSELGVEVPTSPPSE